MGSMFYTSNEKRFRLIQKIKELECDYTIEDVELCFIYNALVCSEWNRAEAARKLGISIRNLRNKILVMKSLGFVIRENEKIKKGKQK